MKKIQSFVFNLVPLFLLAYFFCDINPAESYVWYDGIWDGLCFIPNLVFSIFDGDRLCKALDYTSAYNVCWWIFTVVAVLHIVQLLYSTLFNSGKKM